MLTRATSVMSAMTTAYSVTDWPLSSRNSEVQREPIRVDRSNNRMSLQFPSDFAPPVESEPNAGPGLKLWGATAGLTAFHTGQNFVIPTRSRKWHEWGVWVSPRLAPTKPRIFRNLRREALLCDIWPDEDRHETRCAQVSACQAGRGGAGNDSAARKNSG